MINESISDLPKRKQLRLHAYDYASCGAYFVTICAYQREHLFADVLVGQGLCPCRLTAIGSIVQSEIENIKTRFAHVGVDKYIVMPNHVHLILRIGEHRQGQSPCPTVGNMIGAMKSISTKRANAMDLSGDRKIWQFRYHDHIIHNEQEYLKIADYIDTNPLTWAQDCFYAP
ncbi:MAG: transposase [Ruthenibacterium sp.]